MRSFSFSFFPDWENTGENQSESSSSAIVFFLWEDGGPRDSQDHPVGASRML